MTAEMAYVFVVVLLAAILFATEKIRMDVVGFLALTSLLVGGILTVPEALSGFSDPTVHMIGGLFIVGGAIFHTGLADRIGRSLESRAGGDPQRLLIAILLVTSGISAFLSSTGTIAVMIPIVLSLARRTQMSPSKLMIPLAYATLLGGLLTLIATPPNIIVSNTLEQAGFEPFSFFDFTLPGLCLLSLGLIFILTIGRKLLPERRAASESEHLPTAQELWERYGLSDWMFELEVLPGSPLIGVTMADSAIRSKYGVGVYAVRSVGRSESGAEGPQASRIFRLGDLLFVKGAPDAITRFCEEARLQETARPRSLPPGLVVAELLVPPGSNMVGRSIADTRLRSRFDVNVIAVFRSKEVLRESVARTVVSVGDLFLLVGSARALAKLRNEQRDAILVTETEELRGADFRTEKAPLALLILGGMLVLMAFNLVPPVVAVICTALAMVLFGCIDAESAYKNINWESLLLIATILPLATALTKTGAIDWIVRGLVSGMGDAGPYVVMAAIFLLTATIGLVISNTATAVLVAPVALQVATSMNIQPHALMMTVAVASSAAFVTPVSSPVNMLVVNAGGYKFSDFARMGVPLLLLTLLGTLLVIPWFFPF